MADTVDPETGEILDEPAENDPDFFMTRTTLGSPQPELDRPRPDSGAIAAAIAQVMSEVSGVTKSGRNQFLKYSYATIADLMAALQPALARAELAIVQSEEKISFLADGNIVSVNYSFTLLHSSGAVSPPFYQSGWAATYTPGKMAQLDDKALNKCHTSARKYALLALFCVPTVEESQEKAHAADADGHEMTHRRPPPTPARSDPMPNSWAEGGRDPQPGRLTLIENSQGEPLAGRWLKGAMEILKGLPSQERAPWLARHQDILDKVRQVRPDDTERFEAHIAALDTPQSPSEQVAP